MRISDWSSDVCSSDLSLGAMTNLMCRGRKRGRAGVIATQRLDKLAKNVAAEASNFLMGRTFLDIDMARAADLLGMERRQAEVIRDLERGHFLALGPAVSRRPISVRIGEVKRSEEHTSELQSLMRSSYAVFCLKKKNTNIIQPDTTVAQ